MEENLGGLQFFLDGIWVWGLKMPKDDLGGRGGRGGFKFLLSIKGPDFHSVLHKVLYCVILKQFNQHFDKTI